MSTVHFTLETTIPDTTFYITYGSMNCIKSKKVPESFTETNPASGKAQANNNGSCDLENSKIKLYFWADSEHSEQIGKIKLQSPAEDPGTNPEVDAWGATVQSVANGFAFKVTEDDSNEFTFVLLS